MAIPAYKNFEPPYIIQGDTAFWQAYLTLYPPTQYTLSYYFSPAPVQPFGYSAVTQTFNFQATNNNGIFTVNVPPAVTATYQPGNYYWQAKVTDGVDVITTHNGRMTVKPNIATTQGPSGTTNLMTWEEQTLLVVQQALTGRLPRGIETYTIGGRSISKIPIPELYKLKQQLQAAVDEQKQNELTANETGQENRRQILVRFDDFSGQPPTGMLP